MPAPVQLVSLATALPPYAIDQRDAAIAANNGFSARFSDFERLARIFESSGIRRRYTVRPLEWYLENSGWPVRHEAHIEGASQLFINAASKALAVAGLSGADVDVVVTICSTGIATPSLDARVAQQMGFRTDILRVPVFGLGCAGGVAGMSIAAGLAGSRPGSVVLLVAVETCSLAFRLDKLTKENIVATALFGDGAAACILRAGEEGIASLEMSGQHTWADTLNVMGWSVEHEGLGVIFDRAIPAFAEAYIAPVISDILLRGGVKRADIGRFICHPGGARVITALERSLALEQGTLDHERDVLSDYGNMSAPTALFVLDRVIKQGLPERSLLMAMGPGFGVNCIALKRAA